ncbi:MAG: PQQ-binding-like beta-propeller repeat protein [Chthoniobacteraceae bacterium]
MSLQVPTKEIASFNPSATRRSTSVSVVMALIVTLLVVTLGGASWYYFFGRKPKVAMTVALELNGDTATRGLWSAGPDELLLVGDGDVRLIDLATRKKKWTATIPKSVPVDAGWQAAMNARFVRLQQWSDELSHKRTGLTGEAAIKEFNAEAAKYHAALTAARAEMATPRATPPPAAIAKKPASAAAVPAAAEHLKPGHVFGSDRSAVDALRPVVDANVQIIEARMKKRAAKLQAWRTALDAKKANAKTPLQKSAATEEEARFAAELAEQKKDENSLGKPREKSALPVSVAVAPPSGENKEDDGIGNDAFSSDDASGTAKPQAAICGDRLWIVEGSHAVAFERSTGAVKADVRLAGLALRVFSDTATAIVIASAGAEAVQVVRLGADAQPQSSYFFTGRRVPAFSMSEHSVMPGIQDLRTEFAAIGGSLLRVEIRLKEKRVTTRDAIKAGSEKELESVAGGAAAHSADELKAVTALLRNDSARLRGETIEHVDDSTYEVALKRPFEPDAAEWTGILRGRVQVFSTPTLHLVTAGTKLLAFDRANKKLWEATLGSPLPIRRSDGESGGASRPWIEAGGRLFLADGSFLNAFDAKTGQVVWRLPGVGIRKIQMDGEGSLYVQSDNLSVETLAYAMDASLRDAAPITMRIDPADGKIRWQVEKYQDLWASGKDVYVLRETKFAGDLENQVFSPGRAIQARVKIYKLSRENGSPLWEWFQPRHLQAVEVQGKNVALLFGEELQVIRSMCR